MKKIGYDVDIVYDGEQAVTAVVTAYADKKPYDVIFMDMQMPNMDGLTATKIILNNGADKPNVPWIIAMTANAMPEDKANCFKAGMKGYIDKPVKVKKIELALADYFEAVSV